MHKKFLFLVCCALPWAFNLTAQVTPIPEDSLRSLLSKAYDQYYDYDYKGALETISSLLSEAERTDNSYYIYRSYNKLGSIHNAIDDTVRGKVYYERALEVAQQSKTDSLISWAYNDLANLYAEDSRYYDKSIGYYQKAIDINNAAGFDDYENLVQYMNIGWTYLDMKQPEKAFPFLLKTKKLTQLKEQHPLLLLNLDILFGRYYFYSNTQEKEMLSIFSKAAKAAREGNYLKQQSEAHEYLSKAYERADNKAAALENYKKRVEIDERLHDIEKDFIVTEASAKFDLENYQRELEMARTEQQYADELVIQSRYRSTVFIICTIVLLIASVALFMLYKSRKSYISRLHDKNNELRAAKNEAERLSKLKTQFFSTVSHELRTPLYGVIGISSILLEDKKLKSHRDDLRSLKFSADYLLALINDVLMLNKMDTENLQLERTPFMLSKLLNDIKRSFAFSLEQNNNEMHLELDTQVPDHLLGDSIRLSQVLMNLVGNAIKFNENGNIWLRTEFLGLTDTGKYSTRFVIEDDGIGIPEESHTAIFEEFSQVENNNYNYQGTGLGLPIVKKLLKHFGSEIQLESSLGEGATFSFILELENYVVPTEKMEISESTDQFVNEEHGLENIHILVVDDNRINQKITQKILETRQFNCSLADDGAEAIELAKSHSYDLILMDIHMPGIGGLEATKTIRKFDKRTPIVALTAVEIDEIRKKIADAGMNDIILKPYDVSQFLNTILRNLITSFTRVT